MASRPAIIVFARAPVAGRAKTRLIPALGPERAAELYRCFLMDTVDALRCLAADTILAAATPEDTEQLSASLPGIEMIVQSGADLGERIANALHWAIARGHPAVVAVGTDAPDLPPATIEEALALTTSRDLVLGPCSDGGYYLIGGKAIAPGLVEGIRWSSDSVLSETLTRARQLGLEVALLPQWHDVDTPDDLTRLRVRLTNQVAAGRPIPCPRTWDYLCDLPRDEGV